jgi:hypothetical protein
MEKNKKRMLRKLEDCINSIQQNIIDRVTQSSFKDFEKICQEEWLKMDNYGFFDIYYQLKIVHDTTNEELLEIYNKCEENFRYKLNEVLENKKCLHCYTD